MASEHLCTEKIKDEDRHPREWGVMEQLISRLRKVTAGIVGVDLRHRFRQGAIKQSADNSGPTANRLFFLLDVLFIAWSDDNFHPLHPLALLNLYQRGSFVAINTNEAARKGRTGAEFFSGLQVDF